MDIKINAATEDDLPQIVELLTELFVLESDFMPDHEKLLSGLRCILHDPAIGRLFVLRVEGEVAGMANALITISAAEGGPVVLLEDIVVSRSHRGRGLGRSLFDHVVAWAQGQGMARVTLLADGDNRSALAFYDNLEFELSNRVALRKSLV